MCEQNTSALAPIECETCEPAQFYGDWAELSTSHLVLSDILPRVHISNLRQLEDLCFSLRDKGAGCEPGIRTHLSRFSKLPGRIEHPGTEVRGLSVFKRAMSIAPWAACPKGTE
jgi:hypothetical protein